MDLTGKMIIVKRQQTYRNGGDHVKDIIILYKSGCGEPTETYTSGIYHCIQRFGNTNYN